jgi:putative molybdopterin biosynthesis protein
LKPNIYLENTPLREAIETWMQRLIGEGIAVPLAGEDVGVLDSLGRITSEAVVARNSSPFYHSSAMDGYAVEFSDTFGASERTPIKLNVPEKAVYVSTGGPMPEGYNAVIMIEDVNLITGVKGKSGGQKTEGEYIEIIKPATPWQHVRTVGEDIVKTELILPENHKIRPIDMGAMLAGGHTSVRVRKRPRVVIIPTGSELVEPGSRLEKGNIIESNSRILASLVKEWGGEPVRWPIIPDDMEELKNAVLNASETGDLVIVNAGASAGKKDYTSPVIRELGEVILHGINIKPGKPLILGWVRDRPVLGIPGYPVSAFITFELFAKPIIHIWQGIEIQDQETLKARISRQVSSSMGIEEFVRVKVGKVGDNFIASPVSRGAGMLMSLVRADGFIRIPAMMEGLGAGTEVDVRLMEKKKDEISYTIVCIGSHDNILDILSSFIKRRHPRLSLSSSHVGSMGGLIALKRDEAHLAGTHLLDEETGEYNIPFIKRLIPDKKIVLINLVYRQQGLYVLKGNPKNIHGFKDLERDDVTFINRQAGSGTRLLTDKYLKDLNIDAGLIKGYERDEYTHMTVASAVLNGIADTGLGILAAGKAMGLEFIPLARERYDLAVPERYYGLDMIQSLLDILKNDNEFRSAVDNLGGYDTTDMGKVIYCPSPSG